ncbi:uncharacterized protein METZ01_LOCUS429231, partial [marine metagenome]
MSEENVATSENPEEVETVIVPSTATIPTSGVSSTNTNRDVKSNVQMITLLLIMLCLVSLFGGNVLGTWYTTMTETSSKSSGVVANGQANYGLGAVSVSGKINGEDVLDNETLEIDYDDWDCYCDETESVMNNVKRLVYINTLAGMGIVYFIRYQKFDEKRIINLLFVIMAVSLFAGVYFALSLPDAIDKDGEPSSIYQNQQEDASFVSLNSEISSDGGEIVMKGQWYPNVGFLYLIFN